MGLADGSERSGPRIGAFEVSYKLVNTTSGRQYGPVEIFSKIQTGHWPGAASKLVARVQKELQNYLRADEGNAKMFGLAKAEVQNEQAHRDLSHRPLALAAALPDVPETAAPSS